MYRRHAFTVIEMVVVISIIGILLMLLLPAVQAARESGRRTTCKNHLKQLSLAMLQHEQTQRFFPSNGWSMNWVGDPDRGSGRRQPGSWAYSLLPYLERGDLHAPGRSQPETVKRAAANVLQQTTLAVFNCPSRRGLDLSPYDPVFIPINSDLLSVVAKSDFAVNSGDGGFIPEEEPPSLTAGDDPAYPWRDNTVFTGISFQRSEISAAHVRDGKSFVYMLGEKYVSYAVLNGGFDPGDDQSLYAGFNYDIGRYTMPTYPPTQDGEALGFGRFGSSHVNTCHFAMCDGSVREISYWIDGEVNRRLGNRHDRQIINDDDF